MCSPPYDVFIQLPKKSCLLMVGRLLVLRFSCVVISTQESPGERNGPMLNSREKKGARTWKRMKV